MRTRSTVALALAVGAVGPLAAYANSRVMGIPNECEMTTLRVACAGEGKSATPEKLFSTSLVGADKQVVRAYQMAHDGKRVAFHTFAGLALGSGNDAPVDHKGLVIYKTIEWAPDNHRFRYWGAEGLVIADADGQGPAGEKLKPEFVYKCPVSQAGWVPDGGILVLRTDTPKEKGAKPTTSCVKVFPSGSANELWKSDVIFSYFCVPSSRFENGSGASNAPYSVILGAKDSLWITSSGGTERDKFCDLKGDGLHDFVQSPDSKNLVIRFIKDVPTDGGKVLKGVVLAHLDKFQKGKPVEWETLYEKNDAHTIWSSQTGKYATWASPDVVGFREFGGKPGSEVSVTVPGGKITGCFWDHADARIAITAGNKVYCYDVAKKAVSQVCDLGADPKTFVADPVFLRNDEIVFTVFKDVKQGGK